MLFWCFVSAMHPKSLAAYGDASRFVCILLRLAGHRTV